MSTTLDHKPGAQRSRYVVLAGPPAEWREEWVSRMAVNGLSGSVADGLEDTIQHVLLLEPRTLVLFENSRHVPPMEVVNRLQRERRIPGMEIVVVQKEAPEEVSPVVARAQTGGPDTTPGTVKKPEPQAKGLLGWLKRLFGRR